MTLETLIVIFGIAGSVGALYVAWRAHKNAFKPTDPDDELVRFRGKRSPASPTWPHGGL